MEIEFEELTHSNYKYACEIQRNDIPEAFLDTAAVLMEITDYGIAHHCIGHTFLARVDGKYIGLLLLMGFVVDKEYRGKGLGGEILEKAIARVYDEYGRRSIALGCHKDNVRAVGFYEKHGFVKTNVFEGNDEYYLRMI